MKIILQHATLIDGTGNPPLPDATVVIEKGKIVSAGPGGGAEDSAHDAEYRDYSGKYLIPGLIDSNIHLVSARTPDTLLEYEGRYEELAFEAGEIALKYGLTTVFDTAGPVQATVNARDAINSGKRVGPRVFCAGFIIGLDGPLSDDVFRTGLALEPATKQRINDLFEAGCGARLASMTIDQIGQAVDDYISSYDIDFVKYAGSDHRGLGFLLFSEQAQRRIVDVAHSRGLLVQAHTTTVESLRIEVEAGNDLLQHPDITSETPIPDSLMDEIVERQLPCMALLVTERYLGWLSSTMRAARAERMVADKNNRMFIEKQARMLLTTDAFAYGRRVKEHAGFRPGMLEDSVPDMPTQVGSAHFLWIKAAWERGMEPMRILRSATSFVADAYGKGDVLGTVTPGKLADLVVLDGDPLAAPENYRKIAAVIKDGKTVDRGALGSTRLLADEPHFSD